jgi:GNAT superfamily N-acetyltransferase
MHIRRAQVDEHEVLSRIAREAKAHWGYRAEDLARWEADLTVSADSVGRQPTFVAEVACYIAGFFQLSFAADGPELEHFWVLPAYMGKGIGRALIERAVREIAERGHVRLLIDADPNAERFYIACGAVRTGEKPAPAAGQPQRVRPQLVLSANAT